MHPILRRPGSEVWTDLEGFDGVKVKYKVPDAQEGREMQKQFNLAIKDDNRYIDAAKIVFGRLFVELSGIELEGQEGYTFETDKSGALTEESMAIVMPIMVGLWKLSLELCGFRDIDRKN